MYSVCLSNTYCAYSPHHALYYNINYINVFGISIFLCCSMLVFCYVAVKGWCAGGIVRRKGIIVFDLHITFEGVVERCVCAIFL